MILSCIKVFGTADVRHIKSAQHWNNVDFWPEMGLTTTCLFNNDNIKNRIWSITVLYHRLPVRNGQIRNYLLELILLNSEAVFRRCSVKKGIFKTFAKYTSAEILFLITLQSFSLQVYWKKTPAQIFFCKY